MIAGRAADHLAELGEHAVVRDLYDESGSHVYHALATADTFEIRELLRIVRPLSGSILDLAAGSGRLTLPLLALGRPVTALELSPPMLVLLEQELQRLPVARRERCRIVEGDMSRFDLGEHHGVVVLGTSSITLLDDEGRAGLYACVKGHLVPGGRFVLSTIGLGEQEEGAHAEIALDSPVAGGIRIYEHWPRGARARTVTIVSLAAPEGGPVPVWTSTIGVLDPDALAAELESAGFAIVRRLPVASPFGARHADVLLELEIVA